jgi:hypothetical protein
MTVRAMTTAKRFMMATSLFMVAALNILNITVPSHLEEFSQKFKHFTHGIVLLSGFHQYHIKPKRKE